MSSKQPRIVVLGAGAVGLSTVVQIQEAFPGNVVTLIAEKFNQETTSDGAAGAFIPSTGPPNNKPDELARWANDSFDFFKHLLNMKDSAEAGISHIVGYGYHTKDDYKQEPQLEKIYFDFRPCTEKEKSIYPALENKTKHSFFLSTLMVEGRWYLPYLLKRFTDNGGKVEQRKLKTIDELSGLYDVAVICTGLGSRDLLGDEEIVAVRGQVIRVKAPWIKNFLYVDGYQTYLFPGRETCIIGGTAQYGNYDLEVRKEDTERIWKIACDLIPSLVNAEWQWQWVGLRPARKSIRLERESKKLKNGQLEVVYNYGHGGNGIALSWGTGKHATELVVEAVKEKFNH